MHEPPVGAGSGDTGGANAIGEYLRASRARNRLDLFVDERTGRATSDLPLLIALEGNAWTGEPLVLVGDGQWVWHGQAGMLKQGFELLWRDEAGVEHRDSQGLRRLNISSGEQHETLRQLVP